MRKGYQDLPNNPGMSTQLLIISSQSRKSINYVRSIPKDVRPISSARAMSAQFMIMSSQSIESINYVRSITKDVRPICLRPRDVRAIHDYVLSINRIHQLCPLNHERCPPNLLPPARCPRNS